MLRRCHELVGDGHIHQFCIRSGDRAEFEFAAQHTEMHKFDFTGLAELTAQLCESKVPVYLTMDLDCLDPSCFPGTGTPEAGGVSFLQLLEAIRTVTKANIIGGRPERAGPHPGPHRGVHRHRLQGAPGDAHCAGQGLARLSGITTNPPFYR